MLNTASLSRSSLWILPSQIVTPARPTAAGIHTPLGPPVQYGSSPSTQQYSRRHDPAVPPAQWGDRVQNEKECELFGDPVHAGRTPDLFMAQQDELQTARISQAAEAPESTNTSSVRCVQGGPHEEESPSTACDPTISA